MRFVLSKRRLVFLGVVFLFTLSFLFYAKYSYFLKEDLPVVDVAFAGMGNMSESLYATGVITSAHKFTVQSEVSGMIQDIFVEEGQEVKKGDKLLQLDDSDLKVQVENAQANVEAAQANTKGLHNELAEEQAKANLQTQKLMLEQAKKNLETTKELFKVKAVAKETLEQTERQYKQAEVEFNFAKRQVQLTKNNPTPSQKTVVNAQLKQAQLGLDMAKKQLGKAVIVAPVDGVVVFAPIGPLEKVEKGIAISPGVSLLTLADTKRLQVMAKIEEAESGKVKVGQGAVVTSAANPEKKFYGTVKRVSPYTSASGELSAVEVVIRLEESDKSLKLGSKCDVEIIRHEEKNVLLVPSRAVFQCGANGYCVFGYFDGKVRVKPVAVGMNNGKFVEIRVGLRMGETVVVNPSKKLINGAKVKVKDDVDLLQEPISPRKTGRVPM